METPGKFSKANYALENYNPAIFRDEFRKMKSEVMEEVATMISNRDEDETSSHEENSLLWNINALCVLSWKGWDWPQNKKWNHETSQFEGDSKVLDGVKGLRHVPKTHILRFITRYFPLVLVCFEVTVLAGMTDQGSILKQMIYGDGYYQSPLWRYPRTSASRDSFKPVLAPNGTVQGMSAQILRERPSNEADACLSPEWPLLELSDLAWSPEAGWAKAALWPLVARAEGNGSWIFSHCLPWEYAGLCALALRAQGAEGGGGSRESWWYPRCSLPDPNDHPLMSAEDWEGFRTSSAGLVDSRKRALVPGNISGGRLDLAFWVLTREVCDSKTLNAFDDSFSLFLYQHVSYVYRLGVGEAYLVELITITTLSVFLFFTSFLSEAQQLMQQVVLASSLRCYEDGFPRWSSWEGCGPASQALRRRVEKMLTRKGGYRRLWLHYWYLFWTDLFCDFFLSIRVLFLSYMVMCTEMVTTWDHGVLAVIFSVLAIAFLFDIDDKLMEMLETMGWANTSFYKETVQPMLDGMKHEERVETERYLEAKAAVKEASLRARCSSWLARGLRKPTLWGQPTVRFVGFGLVVALFIVHQLYDSIFYEWGATDGTGGYQIGGLCAAIFVSAAANAILNRSTSCFGNLVQLGLCLLWTYALLREVIINGILVWYADLRPEQSVESHALRYLVYDQGALFFPPLGLHLLGCLLRPLIFYARVALLAGRAASKGAGAPADCGALLEAGRSRWGNAPDSAELLRPEDASRDASPAARPLAPPSDVTAALGISIEGPFVLPVRVAPGRDPSREVSEAPAVVLFPQPGSMGPWAGGGVRVNSGGGVIRPAPPPAAEPPQTWAVLPLPPTSAASGGSVLAGGSIRAET